MMYDDERGRLIAAFRDREGVSSALCGRAASASTEGASFHSPGLTGDQRTVAVKGRHSRGVTNDGPPNGATARTGCGVNVARVASRRGAAGESRPVGAYDVFRPVDPGFRCAAPWAMELGRFGAGGLRPRAHRYRSAQRIRVTFPDSTAPGAEGAS
jgi:hypothetical protein